VYNAKTIINNSTWPPSAHPPPQPSNSPNKAERWLLRAAVIDIIDLGACHSPACRPRDEPLNPFFGTPLDEASFLFDIQWKFQVMSAYFIIFII